MTESDLIIQRLRKRIAELEAERCKWVDTCLCAVSEAPPHWTDCEDQLPDVEDCYLVTWQDSRYVGPFVEVLEYDFVDGWQRIEQAEGEYTILAWMPLPELYRPTE